MDGCIVAIIVFVFVLFLAACAIFQMARVAVKDVRERADLEEQISSLEEQVCILNWFTIRMLILGFHRIQRMKDSVPRGYRQIHSPMPSQDILK